ncbi:uncharacterized protein LOC126334613 isoform X2 [Schistocerca gregaria]|nr:uncharacterized protein LOC126334613 isoform X2 [Schistocerca gregaria]XP_049852977.1 uncharacterized protein LOC126334613 isoform X2 [Schistocerca gregaria]XP_049852978.1 uncharacterized protein LOC126334613 isoform X2 [Schistocerca gregaria]
MITRIARYAPKLLVRCRQQNLHHRGLYIQMAASKFQDMYVIDLRSDTLTVPTKAMREAMYNAEVGDDVYEEDPTVKALERRAAALFGKEAGLFVPSGTMANLLAIMVHCSRRGTELIAGDKSHIYKYEQGSAAHIAGVQVTTVKNKPDGTFDLDEMQMKIRNEDIHEPVTALICIENTHNLCGGKVLPMEWLDELWKQAALRDIPVHVDGARLLNAATKMRVHPAVLTSGCRSVSLCLSKGLGAPVGSLLLGDTTFVTRARYLRKALGGGMRQVGVLAAAGLVALDTASDRLTQDHANAALIANGVSEFGSKYIHIDPASVHTNIIMVNVERKIKAPELCSRLEQVTDEEAEYLGKEAVIVKALSLDTEHIRLVTYNSITDTDAKMVVKKLQFINQELQRS